MSLFPKASNKAAWRGASADGRLIYAIGDIHGRYDLLTDLMGQIAKDRARSDADHPMLIFCGDYVDRGPDSARVVEALIWIAEHADFETRFLLGNHEAALLAFLKDPSRGGGGWLNFGGAETLKSYGVALPAVTDGPQGLENARDVLLARLPASHLSFLRALELMVEVGDYAFVHAGVRPEKTLAEQEDADLLWIRDDFIGHPGPFEKVIVHGHTWVDDQPRILSHRIGVDTGAWNTGVLTAVRIEDSDVRTLQTKPARLAA